MDAYLLGLPTIVDKRHRRLWPVARERQALASQLQSLLRDLGLKRIDPEPEDAIEYMKRREREMAEEEAERARRIADEGSRS